MVKTDCSTLHTVYNR